MSSAGVVGIGYRRAQVQLPKHAVMELRQVGRTLLPTPPARNDPPPPKKKHIDVLLLKDLWMSLV